MIRSILVPLDGSEFGEHAIPLAASLARKSGATLHLVHVHQPAPPIATPGLELIDLYDMHLREDEQAYLADACRRVKEFARVPAVQEMIGNGDVVVALREYAERKSVDMVVMSTHGRGTLGRWWLGAVADELARTMPRPVLMLKPGEGRADLSLNVDIRSMVVALDGTPLAEEMIEPAVRLAEAFGAGLSLVRVCPPVIRASYLPENITPRGLAHSGLEQARALQNRAVKECQDYLDGVGAKLKARGLKVSAYVTINEEPASGILEVARDRYADLIALETHGLRGLSRLFTGSVADKVVRGGEVPVLLNSPAR